LLPQRGDLKLHVVTLGIIQLQPTAGPSTGPKRGLWPRTKPQVRAIWKVSGRHRASPASPGPQDGLSPRSCPRRPQASRKHPSSMKTWLSHHDVVCPALCGTPAWNQDTRSANAAALPTGNQASGTFWNIPHPLSNFSSLHHHVLANSPPAKLVHLSKPKPRPGNDPGGGRRPSARHTRKSGVLVVGPTLLGSQARARLSPLPQMPGPLRMPQKAHRAAGTPASNRKQATASRAPPTVTPSSGCSSIAADHTDLTNTPLLQRQGGGEGPSTQVSQASKPEP